MSNKIRGDDADNTIKGSNSGDAIYGEGGDDLLKGLRGSDHLEGGDGSDTLHGGVGADTLIGGAGSDLLLGGDGDDHIVSDAGGVVHAGAGFDEVEIRGGAPGFADGGGGGDTLRFFMAGALSGASQPFNGDLEGLRHGGEMTLDGVVLRSFEQGEVFFGTKDDVVRTTPGFGVSGGGGDDLLIGTGHADHLSGDTGANTLRAGGGDDILFMGGAGSLAEGGSGQDVIFAGDRSTLYGGAGDDQLSTSLGGSGDLMVGGSGADTIDGSRDRFDTLKGGAGADLLIAGGHDTDLHGGSGNDTYRIDRSLPQPAQDAVYTIEDTSIHAIDLSFVDADPSSQTDDPFHIVNALSGHELALTYSAADNLTQALADLDGDGVADFTVLVTGDHSHGEDFVL